MPESCFQTRINWTATAAAIGGCKRCDVHNVVKGIRKSRRLSALLAAHEVRKLDWQAVASFFSRRRLKPYRPRYVYEVARGFRKNKQLKELLEMYGVIEMFKSEKAKLRQAAVNPSDTGSMKPLQQGAPLAGKGKLC